VAVPSPVPEAPPGDYRHRGTLWIGPNFWRWAAVAAAFFVVVLSFFPWLGYYPGGVPVRTQSAWQAAFGGESVDADLAKKVPLFDAPAKDKGSPGPGSNGLLIVYVLLLFPLLLLTAAVAVWDLMPLPQLPAAVQGLRPWRWLIVTGLALLALLFLVVQMLAGFSLESTVQARVESAMPLTPKDGKTLPPKEARERRMERGLLVEPLRRTGALRGASSLNMLLLVSALVMFWLERRGARPHPRIDVLW
jgi:hypothetical protein